VRGGAVVKTQCPGPSLWYRKSAVIPVVLVLLAAIASPAAASEPTVIVSGYEVSPPVLVPGETGTITITLSNTAQSATRTDSVATSSFGGTQTVTTNTAINSVVESILLKGEGIEVLSDSYTGWAKSAPASPCSLRFSSAPLPVRGSISLKPGYASPTREA